MVVLNRKRLILITLCVFVSVFTFMISSPSEEEIIQTVNLPVSGKTIILDAGHGVPDEGDFELKLDRKI